MDIIVLNVSPYKEKDAILLALNKNILDSYLVKGIYSQKGTNLALATPLNIVDIALREGKYKYPVVSESKLIYSPYGSGDDLNVYASLSLIAEACRSLLDDKDKLILADELKKTIYSFKEKKIDPVLVALLFLAKAMKCNGYEFTTSHCVECDRKDNIVAFSFTEGGFLCQEHLQNINDAKFTRDELLLIHFVLSSKTLTNYPSFKRENGLNVLNAMARFIDEYLGVKLKSVSLFL